MQIKYTPRPDPLAPLPFIEDIRQALLYMDAGGSSRDAAARAGDPLDALSALKNNAVAYLMRDIDPLSTGTIPSTHARRLAMISGQIGDPDLQDAVRLLFGRIEAEHSLTRPKLEDAFGRISKYFKDC